MEKMHARAVYEELQPVGKTHAGEICGELSAVYEELQPVGRTHAGELCGGLSPMKRTSGWIRGRV